MNPTRYVIVNADDFGLSEGVNEGIIVAHERGIVTSASLMVRQPAAVAGVLLARTHPKLSLGLHVDLGEWDCQNGAWVPVYEVTELGDRPAVAEEVARQLNEFRRIVGRNPTHIDSHQHVHRRDPVKATLVKLATELAIPLRHFSPSVTYRGDYYGRTTTGVRLPGALGPDRLVEILKSLPPGVSELACHPGLGCDLVSPYNHERADEVAALCDPRVRETLIALGIVLLSFGGLDRVSALRRSASSKVKRLG